MSPIRATWLFTVVSTRDTSTPISALNSPRAIPLATSVRPAVRLAGTRARIGDGGAACLSTNGAMTLATTVGPTAAAPAADDRTALTRPRGGDDVTRHSDAAARGPLIIETARAKVVSPTTRTLGHARARRAVAVTPPPPDIPTANMPMALPSPRASRRAVPPVAAPLTVRIGATPSTLAGPTGVMVVAPPPRTRTDPTGPAT